MFTSTVPVLDPQHDAASQDYPALSGRGLAGLEPAGIAPRVECSPAFN
jgi:hypothetical protein